MARTTPRLCSALALFAAICAACANAAPPEAVPGDGVDASTLGSAGDPCDSHDQCASEICFESTCAAPCTGGCPKNTSCASMDIDGLGVVDICVPLEKFLCRACDSADACGDPDALCLPLSDGSFCATSCADDAESCPVGFSCSPMEDEGGVAMVCLPDSGVCCVDGDGDFRGHGDACRAGDCDDENPTIYDDAVEVCDGVDNDCDGQSDVDVTDCNGPECRLGADGYAERPAYKCIAGECKVQPSESCGVYACEDGGEDGNACATSCDGEDDAKCGPGAHCDSGSCTVDLDEGDSCNESSDCTSEHCDSGLCCAFGDCCEAASDCPTFGTFSAVCENPPTCQGTRGQAVCTDAFTCATTGEEEDDSACTDQTVASTCGFYPSVYCTGELSQTAPTCPTSCDNDTECDDNGYCNDSGECVEDRVDGTSCERDQQCGSDHCENGFCCEGGDCCRAASDCPASYSTEPVCTSPGSCQGERDVAQCIQNVCSTVEDSADDSGCDGETVANQCGPYRPVTCSGNVTQTQPPCPTFCSGDFDCDADAYCNEQDQCEWDEPDGGACTGDGECESDHCQNGFCCEDGDCCADAGDCNFLDQSPVCDDQSSCQGSRVEGVCTDNVCEIEEVNDDSGCAGLPADDCGPYPTIFCTGSGNQSSNQSAMCADGCSGESDCDPSAHCSDDICEPDQGQGGFCSSQADCGSDLTCVDNVCCGGPCNGTCAACDLSGSEGTCTLVPDGQDPDLECPSISCAGHYWGWENGSCYRKADVSAAGATCGGDGSCGSTVEECTAQTARGTVALSCDPVCQSPASGTCTGTTAGSCQNLTIGTETCGQGVCQITVDRCLSGVQQECQPNTAAASSETCDGVDNDCDGSIDDGLDADDYESNDLCTSNEYLGVLPEGQGLVWDDMTLYSSGDVDWYRQLTTESFDSCTPGVDEEYQYQVLMQPPAGEDYDLEVCYNSYSNSSCSASCYQSNGGGDQAESVTLIWAGPCGGGTNDGLNFFIHVYPWAGASSCEPYELTTLFVKTN